MDPHFYQGVLRKSAEEDGVEIITGFRDVIKGGAQVGLRLVNYYKGLPISYPATLVELNNGVLELDVHQQQAVALEATRCTFVKCTHFPHPLLAAVKDVDVRRMMASLHNFSFVEILAERRVSLRLELDPPGDAEILLDGGSVEGKLLDVSLGGFSIRTSRLCEFAKGSEVRLRVKIPSLIQDSHTVLEMNSIIVDAAPGQNGGICRFSIDSDPRVEGIISRFIFQRQVDIIKELKEQT